MFLFTTELGINFEHIWAKTVSVLLPTKQINEHILDDADLAGPLVFCFLFGTCLLLVRDSSIQKNHLCCCLIYSDKFFCAVVCFLSGCKGSLRIHLRVRSPLMSVHVHADESAVSGTDDRHLPCVLSAGVLLATDHRSCSDQHCGLGERSGNRRLRGGQCVHSLEYTHGVTIF